MQTIRTDAGPVAHGNAPHGEEGFLVPLSEGLETLEVVDGRDRELVEGHDGGDLARGLELLRGQRLEHLAESGPKRVEVGDVTGDADRTRMSAKADEHVGALLDGMEEVHGPDGTTRSAGDAVRDREEDRRHVEAVDETRRHDALDPLVPALPAHDDDPSSLEGRLGKRHGLLRE